MPTVTVKKLIVPSGAVTCTVCVEKTVKPVRVTVLGEPTVAEVAASCGEPGGADVEAAPKRSEAETPIALTARIENVCHAEDVRLVAVYVVPTTSTVAPPSTLTVYFRIAEPPVFVGGVQLAVIAVEVTPLKSRAVGASGTVASVARFPVRAEDVPAPLTTVIENECVVPGASPLAM